MIQRPRGTRDFLPDEAYRRGASRKKMERILERWGYQEIGTPTFEHLELFTLKSGEGVLEEIYSFQDKGGRDMALRPELTAPVMRMYVNELQNVAKPLRLWYFGNCFRYERPQKGRFREFWQLGAELIGGKRPDSEAEVIALADSLIKSLGVKGDIHVGYLGLIRSLMNKVSPQHRPGLMRMIDKKERQRLSEAVQDLGLEHLGLLELIDLKGRKALDRALELSMNLSSIPDVADGQAPESASLESISPAKAQSARGTARAGREVEAEMGLDEFLEMVDLLDSYGVQATIDFEIVRGLEYYTGTVFEIYASGLGAQSQICGGGSYQLASLFGGAETSSTGFGLGFDRLMEVAGETAARRPPAVLAFTPEVRAEALKVAGRLREVTPLVVDVMGRGLGAQLKSAASAGAAHVIIMGKKELEEGRLGFRDMDRGAQESLTLEEIEERLGGKQGQN
ncbi:MAG: histidine--tRNA ligase [Methanosarcinales archaeon]|nr:histidine--tRNA ligase [Methanosarcinales archaeon]